MNHLPFVKMSGAGNDFILFADRDLRELDRAWLATKVCTRALSIGADGIIIVSPIADDSVQIEFYNPDGSLAEMCGNGSRCAARYAYDNRLVRGDEFTLQTDSGVLPVSVTNDQFNVVMPEPADLKLDYMEFEDGDLKLAVHAVRVGVPHCVVIIDELDALPDLRLIDFGRALRHHEKFPDGVNANFVALREDGTVRQRTYERGVENLTKACGTGATAIAHVLSTRNEATLPVELIVDGGTLAIAREDDRYWLSGDTRFIATGVMSPEAVEWQTP